MLRNRKRYWALKTVACCTFCVAALCFWLTLSRQTAHAASADGVTGLPADVTPLLSLAGVWQPVDDTYITANCNGTLANTFTGNFTTDTSGREHVIATGWQYCGFNNTATSITPV